MRDIYGREGGEEKEERRRRGNMSPPHTHARRLQRERERKKRKTKAEQSRAEQRKVEQRSELMAGNDERTLLSSQFYIYVYNNLSTLSFSPLFFFFF